MQRHLDMKCSVHDIYECGDNVLVKKADGRYGLLIHDGGTSCYEIRFCPFCGFKLPVIELED